MQIFDAFNPRLQDANKKVNQFALESAVVMIPILKESLHHVLVPMVTVISDNLNSKHAGIYTAAVTVMDALIANIGNAALASHQCRALSLCWVTALVSAPSY